MTLKGLIEYIDQVKPNAFTPEVKTVWVNEIEGMIQEQIMLLSPADIITYDYAEDAETELLVPPPHTKLYYAYLQAMIDFAVGEYRNYANTMELFNRWWNEYAAWYALRIDPASGDAKFRGYYLSAYAIAVKHGYTGTEEEWAQVLIDAAENARRAEEAAGTATAASDTAQAAADTATAAAGSAQDAAASATEAQNAALLSAKESQTAANRAETALTRAPKIIDGVWFVWDATAGTYVSTGVTAEGGGSGLDPTAAAKIPATAEMDETGLVSFKNKYGTEVFTLDLGDLSDHIIFGNLLVSIDNLEITEGTENTFTVALDVEPTGRQVVYLAVSDNTRLSVTPTVLTFTPEDYSTPQTVTVTSLQDDDELDDTVTVNITSRKVDSKQITVIISDDDKPELITDGLFFDLNLRGRTADNGEGGDHSLVDSVNGYVCTANHIAFDGVNDGFTDAGLVLNSIDSVEGYNVYQPTTFPSILMFSSNELYGETVPEDTTQAWNTTIEVTGVFAESAASTAQPLDAYSPVTGIMIKCTSTMTIGTSAKYYNTDGTMITLGTADWTGLIQEDGTIVDINDVIDLREEHTFAVSHSQDGKIRLYVDGCPTCNLETGECEVVAENFAYWYPQYKAMQYGVSGDYYRKVTDKQTVAHIRAYRRVLDPEEVRQNYKYDKSQQTVSTF